METNKLVVLFAVAAMVAISLLASGCTQGGSLGASSQGRTVFTLTDAAADMGTVTSVKVTVDRLEVQHATKGWTTVSSVPYTYDLLQLKASGSQSLLADVKLDEGAYGQVRMHISKVMITDSTGEHEAKLPSSDLKIVGGFEVTQNSTTVVTFDFLADKSVHVTGNGKYILAPVVRMQGREEAEVDARERENVKVIGGRVRTDTEVGMDEDGVIGVGVGISTNANITIDGDRIFVHGENQNSNPGATANGNTVVVPVGGVISIGEQLPSGNGPGQEIGIDVTACTVLSNQEERLSCIAQWCGSENRDYTKCYTLVDNDDKLGCLNKCNPNSNI